MHPATESILKHFQYSHLPPDLAAASKPFCDLAHQVATTYPDDPEKTTCLRKLLEAKDCAVRSFLSARDD